MGLFSGLFGGGGDGRAAAGMQAQHLQDAIRTIEGMQRQTREDIAPWMGAGQEALQRQRDIILGGDLSQFYTSPGYQFRLQEGQRALERGAAARGNLLSGAQQRALTRYGQNIASEEFGNVLGRIGGLSTQGLGAGLAVGQLGAASASNVAGLQARTGDVLASGIMADANRRASLGSQLLGFGGAALGSVLGPVGGAIGGQIASRIGGGGAPAPTPGYGQVGRTVQGLPWLQPF